MGYADKKAKQANKAETGHAAKANTAPKRFVKEIAGEEMLAFEVGQEVKGNIFVEGELVDVTGTSKGKGFQGIIKRYNAHLGPMAHGSGYHRGVGSLSANSDPSRVFKNKKMPGQYGNEKVTIQNLEITKEDVERNLLFGKVAIPGAKGSVVTICSAVKA